MQFIVLGYDGKDEQALDRRLAVRSAHLALGDQLRAAGNLLYAVAMLNDDGNMVGSVMVMDFSSREDLDAWIVNEPYVTGKVWERYEVMPGKVGPSFLNAQG